MSRTHMTFTGGHIAEAVSGEPFTILEGKHGSCFILISPWNTSRPTINEPNTGAAAVFCISQNDIEKNIFTLTCVKDSNGGAITARVSDGGYVFDYETANANSQHDGIKLKVKVLG
jgi:hypothetical protein